MQITEEFFLMSPDPVGVSDPNRESVKLMGAFHEGRRGINTSRITFAFKNKEGLLNHGLDINCPLSRSEAMAAKLTKACGWKKMPRIFLLTVTTTDQSPQNPNRKAIVEFDLIKIKKATFFCGTTIKPKLRYEYLLSFLVFYKEFVAVADAFDIYLSPSEYKMLTEAGKNPLKLDFQFQEIPPEKSKGIRQQIRMNQKMIESMKRTAYPIPPKT